MVGGCVVQRPCGKAHNPSFKATRGCGTGGRARAASCRWGDRGEGLCFTVPSLPLGLLMRRGVGTEVVVRAEHRHLCAGRWVGVSGIVSPARALPLRALIGLRAPVGLRVPTGAMGLVGQLRCPVALRKGTQPLVQSNEGLWHGELWCGELWYWDLWYGGVVARGVLIGTIRQPPPGGSGRRLGLAWR